MQEIDEEEYFLNENNAQNYLHYGAIIYLSFVEEDNK